jgi:hypothetical protein
MNKKTFVYCTFQKEAYHFFPGADQDPQYATGDEYDVSHLASRHMHYFNFKVWVEVTHNNRQIEFIQLRRWIESLYAKGTLELNHQSCEMLSDALCEKLAERYPGMEIRIDVSEEGINGSYTEFVPE